MTLSFSSLIHTKLHTVPCNQGTKHEFFGIYSKEAEGGTVAALPKGSQKGGSNPAPSAATAPPPRSLTAGMPVVLQPAVSGARATASARSALATSHSPDRLPIEHQLPADSATVPMPRGKSRVVFDPENMGPSSGATGSQQRSAPGWFSGPFKDGGRVSNMSETIERMTSR